MDGRAARTKNKTKQEEDDGWMRKILYIYLK